MKIEIHGYALTAETAPLPTPSHLVPSKMINFTVCLLQGIMVNVDKGILVECDPAMKQFLLQLDDTKALGKKFVIKDLDDTHLFISADILEILQDQVDGLMDKLAFPLAEK